MIRNSTPRLLHPPASKGKKKKSKLHKEFGKKIPKNSGGDWKTSERWHADPRRVQSSLCQVYPLCAGLCTPPLLAIHTPQHTKTTSFFLLETQISDQVAPMLDKSLMMIMPQETQIKIAGGCALGSISPITYWIHSPFGKVLLCH